MRRSLIAMIAVGLVSTAAVGSVSAETFRWASAGDILTFDVHSQNESQNSAACAAVYESLLRFNKAMKPEASLALSWQRNPENTGWIFKLRDGVKFHEGETLCADDVVFSINRALLPQSQFRSTAVGILGAEKIDNLTVLIKTQTASPSILTQLTDLRIMNRAWCEKHEAILPQDYIAQKESYLLRHANGTGPFKLVSREVDIKTVFEANPNWWDQANRPGNVTRAEFTPIASAATRTAALLSGQIDFVLDPATQDLPRLKRTAEVKVLEGPESRVILFALDQYRDQPLYVSVDGKAPTKNPFKDQRVREALAIALDRVAIQRAVMRGQSVPTGTIVPATTFGYAPEAASIPKVDIAKAKALLSDAGYPNGFSFTLDCTNNRYVNDEGVCKAAASMWAKAGLTVTVNAMPRSQFFPKVLRFDTSACIVGWGSATQDAYYQIQGLSMTYNPASGDGISNVGRASSPALDAIGNQIRSEGDPIKRERLLQDALLVERKEWLHIPVHAQVVPWVMRANVTAVHRPDNRVTIEWITVSK